MKWVQRDHTLADPQEQTYHLTLIFGTKKKFPGKVII